MAICFITWVDNLICHRKSITFFFACDRDLNKYWRDMFLCEGSYFHRLSTDNNVF